jgi:hypothetical protein
MYYKTHLLFPIELGFPRSAACIEQWMGPVPKALLLSIRKVHVCLWCICKNHDPWLIAKIIKLDTYSWSRMTDDYDLTSHTVPESIDFSVAQYMANGIVAVQPIFRVQLSNDHTTVAVKTCYKLLPRSSLNVTLEAWWKVRISTCGASEFDGRDILTVMQHLATLSREELSTVCLEEGDMEVIEAVEDSKAGLEKYYDAKWRPYFSFGGRARSE